MENNKDSTPTIQETLRMIEAKLANNKTKKKGISNKDTKNIASNNTPLSNIFRKKEVEKKKIKKDKKDNVLLLTKKVNISGKILDSKKKNTDKKIRTDKKNNITSNSEEIIKEHIPNYKILSKTGDLAVIINKLKVIRDQKLQKDKKKKNSKKNLEEIKKLNETIFLAEELFKKELLDL